MNRGRSTDYRPWFPSEVAQLAKFAKSSNGGNPYREEFWLKFPSVLNGQRTAKNCKYRYEYLALATQTDCAAVGTKSSKSHDPSLEHDKQIFQFGKKLERKTETKQNLASGSILSSPLTSSVETKNDLQINHNKSKSDGIGVPLPSNNIQKCPTLTKTSKPVSHNLMEEDISDTDLYLEPHVGKGTSGNSTTSTENQSILTTEDLFEQEPAHSYTAIRSCSTNSTSTEGNKVAANASAQKYNIFKSNTNESSLQIDQEPESEDDSCSAVSDSCSVVSIYSNSSDSASQKTKYQLQKFEVVTEEQLINSKKKLVQLKKQEQDTKAQIAALEKTLQNIVADIPVAEDNIRECQFQLDLFKLNHTQTTMMYNSFCQTPQFKEICKIHIDFREQIVKEHQNLLSNKANLDKSIKQLIQIAFENCAQRLGVLPSRLHTATPSSKPTASGIISTGSTSAHGLPAAVPKNIPGKSTISITSSRKGKLPKNNVEELVPEQIVVEVNSEALAKTYQLEMLRKCRNNNIPSRSWNLKEAADIHPQTQDNSRTIRQRNPINTTLVAETVTPDAVEGRVGRPRKRSNLPPEFCTQKKRTCGVAAVSSREERERSQRVDSKNPMESPVAQQPYDDTDMSELIQRATHSTRRAI